MRSSCHVPFLDPRVDLADDAPETATLLRRIGAPETASLLVRGCELFPNGRPSKNYQQRRLQLEKLAPAQLKALDELTEKSIPAERTCTSC